VIVTFAYPSTPARAGGVTMLYEFANALARRGHQVHFVHGPLAENRITNVGQLSFRFDSGVHHHIVDTLDDPSLPDGDVAFTPGPQRLGQRAVLVQGFRLLGPEWDRRTFRVRAPKVCIASWLTDVGRWFGVPAEQLVYIPMGLDHDLFSVRSRARERRFDVAMLYHPAAEKGWNVALEALWQIHRRVPGLRAVVFTLAGQPPDDLPSSAEVLVNLDQTRLARDVYNATRIHAQTSYHEGFGLTAVEAMACGAALVTTDCGGSRDYAFDGETARVVPRGDATAIAERVEDLLADESRRCALAAAGTRLVRQFTWERSGEQLEQFLERYIADPTRFQGPLGPDRSEEYQL
jgi:glycosyltransferase involved in cell wall biosynthesis